MFMWDNNSNLIKWKKRCISHLYSSDLQFDHLIYKLVVGVVFFKCISQNTEEKKMCFYPHVLLIRSPGQKGETLLASGDSSVLVEKNLLTHETL